jgi:hypothetical protein
MKKPKYLQREEAYADQLAKAEQHARRLAQQKHEQQSAFQTLSGLVRTNAKAEDVMAKIHADTRFASLFAGLGSSSEKAADLVRMARTLSRRCPSVLDVPQHDLGLARMTWMLEDAIRPLETFCPKGKKQSNMIEQLARHLFVRYAVPAFLLRDFLEKAEYLHWFFAWTNGTSPLKMEDSPIPMTRRMAHELQFAPEEYSVPKALRWAQARSLGADEEAACHVAEAFQPLDRLFSYARDWDMDAQHPAMFAETVIRFLLANTSIRGNAYGPVVDYVFDQKYTIVYHSEACLAELRNPKFSMKGRSPKALLQDVRAWHHTMHMKNTYKAWPQAWRPMDIQGWSTEQGTGDNMVTFTFYQLSRQRDLFWEGSSMHHCVASYIPRCVQGDCSIWTMESRDINGAAEKLVTIEVSKGFEIVQARGMQNRVPRPLEAKLIRQWAKREGLKIRCSYV